MPLNFCLLLSWLDAIDKAHPWLLGLVGSGLIAYVVYRAEKTNNEKAAKRQAEAIQADKTRDQENSTRRFIMDNIDEADFIPLCIFAVNAAPKMRHKRAIYNRFNYMTHDVQQEILKQQGILLQLPSNDSWVDACLEKLQADVRKYKLANVDETGRGNDWLYDNFKYFKNGLRKYGNESAGNDLLTYFSGMPINQSKRAEILGGDSSRDIGRYIDEWIRKKSGKNTMLKETAKSPLDWLHDQAKNNDKLFCLYMMQAVWMIAACMYQLSPIDEYQDNLKESIDDNLGTGQKYYYEDVYFKALSWLYITYYNKEGAQ